MKNHVVISMKIQAPTATTASLTYLDTFLDTFPAGCTMFPGFSCLDARRSTGRNSPVGFIRRDYEPLMIEDFTDLASGYVKIAT